MAVIAALVLDEAEQARVRRELDGMGPVRFCTSAPELMRLVETTDLRAILAEVRDDAGDSMVLTLGLLHQRFPSLPIVLLISLTGPEVRELLCAASSGLHAVAIRGSDDLGARMRAEIAERPARDTMPDRPPRVEGGPRPAHRRAASILVVEDDASVRDVLTRLLDADGHTVHAAADGDEGLRLALDLSLDAILLDLELPSRDGLDVMRELRRRGNEVPVIVVTGKTGQADIIAGFKAGANAYVGKPFDVDVMRAHVGAVLERGNTKPSAVLRVGDLVADPLARRVSQGGSTLTLTPKEFDLLCYLMRHAGRVVTLDTIAVDVWKHPQRQRSSETYAVCLGSLRRKLHRAGRDPLLHTLRAEGYMLSA